jgi:hypothetical protein
MVSADVILQHASARQIQVLRSTSGVARWVGHAGARGRLVGLQAMLAINLQPDGALSASDRSHADELLRKLLLDSRMGPAQVFAIIGGVAYRSL